jgi:symplekin
VPDGVPMADMAREFALQLLRRLRAPGTGDGEMDEDGQLVPDELVQTPYLPPVLTLPAKRTEVLQHVEFVFALCVKVPELLAECVLWCRARSRVAADASVGRIFEAYGVMDGSVQALLQELVTPLVRSLGPGHAQLLMCLRRFPPGADGLVLRVLRIFTDGGARPSAPLVALVKALVADRDLDVRFLVPIIGEMDKVEIIKNLPRVVGTLDGTQANKDLVRTVFASIVQTPAQTFGSVTSNLPRGPQGELLSPKELMVLLHESEDIERKSAMEGQWCKRRLGKNGADGHRSDHAVLLDDGRVPLGCARRGHAADRGSADAADALPPHGNSLRRARVHQLTRARRSSRRSRRTSRSSSSSRRRSSTGSSSRRCGRTRRSGRASSGARS